MKVLLPRLAAMLYESLVEECTPVDGGSAVLCTARRTMRRVFMTPAGYWTLPAVDVTKVSHDLFDRAEVYQRALS